MSQVCKINTWNNRQVETLNSNQINDIKQAISPMLGDKLQLVRPFLEANYLALIMHLWGINEFRISQCQSSNPVNVNAVRNCHVKGMQLLGRIIRKGRRYKITAGMETLKWVLLEIRQVSGLRAKSSEIAQFVADMSPVKFHVNPQLVGWFGWFPLEWAARTYVLAKGRNWIYKLEWGNHTSRESSGTSRAFSSSSLHWTI